MEELRRPAILHEIQNTPEIMAHVRTRIDAAFPSCTGWPNPWTGGVSNPRVTQGAPEA